MDHLEALGPESDTTLFWISPGGSESVLSILQMVHLETLGLESGTTPFLISLGGSESALSIFQNANLNGVCIQGPSLAQEHVVLWESHSHC